MIVLHYLPHFRHGACGGRMWCAFEETTGEALDYQHKKEWLESDLVKENKPYKVRRYHRAGGHTDTLYDKHATGEPT